MDYLSIISRKISLFITNNLDVEIFAFSKSINYPTARKVC